MGKFILKILIFLFIAFILSAIYLIYSRFIYRNALGISTSEQITNTFKFAEKSNHQMLIIGSSLLYRGINPDSITFIKSYNASHDNDSYNQFYYKLLRITSKNPSITHIILGVDYFNFSRFTSSRNYIYKNFFPKEYIQDYIDRKEQTNSINKFIEINYSNTFTFLIKQSMKYYSGRAEQRFMKDNGQFIIPFQIAKENQKMSTRENYTPIDIQINYFKKIVDLTKQKKLKLILVFPPVREYILDYPLEKDKIFLDSLWSSSVSENIYFLNYSRDKRFILKDFHDYIHLNTKGADKFSSILNKDIQQILLNDK